MIDFKSELRSLSFRLSDDYAGFDGKNRAVMLDDVIDLYQTLEDQCNNSVFHALNVIQDMCSNYDDCDTCPLGSAFGDCTLVEKTPWFWDISEFIERIRCENE